MYWHNPVVETNLNCQLDPIASGSDQHCLFYIPAMPISKIKREITLQETCDLANRWLDNPNSIVEPGDVDKILNVVRINQFVHSLRQAGNIKPMLLQYMGSEPLQAATGGSRLMAAERIPEMQTVPVFVSTHSRHRHRFESWEQVTNLAQFADHCGAGPNTQFYFRFTDQDAPYALDWYEVALESTSVPGNNHCEIMLKNYVGSQGADFKFTPQWFDQAIDWTTLGHH